MGLERSVSLGLLVVAAVVVRAGVPRRSWRWPQLSLGSHGSVSSKISTRNAVSGRTWFH